METLGQLRKAELWLKVSCVSCTAVLHLHQNFIAKELPDNLKLRDAGHHFPCPYCSKSGTTSETICKPVNPLGHTA